MQYRTETPLTLSIFLRVFLSGFRQVSLGQRSKRKWMHACSHRSYDPKHQPREIACKIWRRRQSESTDFNTQEYHDVGEKTPLHYSVEKNNFEITNFLLDNGANTTLGDKRGLTALHYAARFGFK